MDLLHVLLVLLHLQWYCEVVYEGGFDTAHSVSRAYDRAAIKFQGVDADINFKLSNYDDDMKQISQEATNVVDGKLEWANFMARSSNYKLDLNLGMSTPSSKIGQKEIASSRQLQFVSCDRMEDRNQTDQHGKFDAKADEGIFVGYAIGKSYRVYNLRTNIVMESIHVMFDDKKIEGLQDGDFLESLKFDNMEMVSDDSDDQSDQETLAKDDAEKSKTNEAHNSTSIEL
ncbi:hypothetical protein AgCh_039199 [Apium graveolens]